MNFDGFVLAVVLLLGFALGRASERAKWRGVGGDDGPGERWLVESAGEVYWVERARL